MFNNPFDSFHDTVAEAKEEREQLNRLLTISTPRERILVAAIAFLLFILAAWLFFGNVTRTLSVDGVVVEPDKELLEGNRSVQVLVLVDGDVVPNINVGMLAAVKLDMANGDAETFDGEIAAVSTIPLPEEFSAIESALPVSLLRVDMVLDEFLDVASVAGKECRIVIELGGKSPISVFGLQRS